MLKNQEGFSDSTINLLGKTKMIWRISQGIFDNSVNNWQNLDTSFDWKLHFWQKVLLEKMYVCFFWENQDFVRKCILANILFEHFDIQHVANQKAKMTHPGLVTFLHPGVSDFRRWVTLGWVTCGSLLWSLALSCFSLSLSSMSSLSFLSLSVSLPRSLFSLFSLTGS